MNEKSTGLDWYYSKSFWKLKFQVTNSKIHKQAVGFYLCERPPRFLNRAFYFADNHDTVTGFGGINIYGETG